MLRTGSIWEDIHPVHQQVRSMLTIPAPSNAGVRMSAMHPRYVKFDVLRAARCAKHSDM
jgi:hypothetical protein